MNDRRLQHLLDGVAGRFRRLLLWRAMALAWLVAAALTWIGVVNPFAWGFTPAYSSTGMLVVPLLALGAAWILTCRAARDRRWVARQIEHEYPTLDSRLITATEILERADGSPPGYLARQVVEEALRMGEKQGWGQTVSSPRLLVAQLLQWGALALFLAAVIHGRGGVQPQGASRDDLLAQTDDLVVVDPGDSEVERGSSVLILARFPKRLPREVSLAFSQESGTEQSQVLSKSLDDPVFVGRLDRVAGDTAYHVAFDGRRSRTFQLRVFDYPAVERVDVDVVYPEYTGLSPVTIKDTLRVTAVEGTRIAWRLHLNRPVAEASLVSREGEPQALQASPEDPAMVTAEQTVRSSGRYVVALRDAQGRAHRDEVELVVVAVPNRRPDLKLAFPRGEQSVSPLEEVLVEGESWDDFGLREVGLEFTLSGGGKHVVPLAANVPGNKKEVLAHQIALETLGAAPDQFLSLALYADDLGPDSQMRRTYGEMHFAEIRRFEEVFRQGPEQSGGGQGAQGAAGRGSQAEELLRLQRDIISATWNQIRAAGEGVAPERIFENVDVIRQSQQQAERRASQQGAQAQDAPSQALLREAIAHMQQADQALGEAVASRNAYALHDAMAPEQAAYETLLRLRAREHLVARGQGGGGGGGGGASRQQLQQLELDNNVNRYETQTQAQQQPSDESREENRMLNRLKELARRQKDINQRLRELQLALQAADGQEARQEIERQLKRLREQQRDMVRDIDEMRQEMDQSGQAERWQDQRDRLAQIRENARQAAEAFEQAEMPSALSAGTRAERQLETTREEMRQRSASRFRQTMRDLRHSAREMVERQRDLARQFGQRASERLRSLRNEQVDQAFRQKVADQKRQLEEVLERMRAITTEAEQAEPLLSKQLYDAYRRAAQDQIFEKLDLASSLANQGFPREAEPFLQQATGGLDRLRQGIEAAAESVLGDEAAGLRLARDELTDLARQIADEIRRQTPQSEQGLADEAAGDRAQARRGGASPVPGRGDPQQRERPPEGNDDPRTYPGEKRQPGEARSGRASGTQDDQVEGPPAGEPSAQGAGRTADGDDARTPGRAGERSDAGSLEPGQTTTPVDGGDPQDRGREESQGRTGRDMDVQSNQSGEDARNGNPFRGGDRAGGGGRAGVNDGWFEEILGGLSAPGGPLTGDDFRAWSDRMRDVEEMLDDPRLRQEVERIRGRAQEFRAEFRRHSTPPQWDLVRDTVAEPLVELRDRVAEELARRDHTRDNVPIDRDPVPRPFVKEVREYYKALGRGD